MSADLHIWAIHARFFVQWANMTHKVGQTDLISVCDQGSLVGLCRTIKVILFWREICQERQKLQCWTHGFHLGWPWEVKGQGYNPLIWKILKTVIHTRLDAREDFFESSHGLSIGTVRFDLGWLSGVKNQNFYPETQKQTDSIWPTCYISITSWAKNYSTTLCIQYIVEMPENAKWNSENVDWREMLVGRRVGKRESQVIDD